MKSATTALVLAAGAASRFVGGGKLRQELAGRPVLGWVLDSLADAAVTDVVVVASGEDERTAALAARCGARLAVNPAPARGMGYSIACGMAAVPRTARGVLVCLGDMPLVQPATYRALADALESGSPTADVIAPAWQGRRGNPVLFGSRHFGALAVLDGDRGARDLLARDAVGLLVVDVDDPGVVSDIDRMEDLAAARMLLEARESAR